MGVRVRFAPSPTGRLHVGNVRVALINFLFARNRGGQFILRLDDTDRERSTAEFAAAIEADLRWLGLDWDRKFAQSDRLGQYEAAAARLKLAARLYPCYETPQELEFKRKRALAQGKPPVYDRAALRLGNADRIRLEAEGRRPHWRFKLENTKTAWVDLLRGAQEIDEASQSDPVLVRADGTFLYTLTSVVDDIDTAITQVIRGEDHVTNTGTQIQIFRALGARAPEFAHLPLLTDAAGAGLSKRLGSLSIGDLRAHGYEPLALAALLAHLGTADAVAPVPSLQPLIDGFAFEKFSRGTPKFSLDELAALNAKVLHQMPYELAAARGRELGLAFDEKLWLAVRPNLQFLGDLAHWREVCQGEIAPAAVAREFAAAALSTMPEQPWGEQTWKQWSQAVAKATGKKGRELYEPLRLALTGREHGPEMHNLLPLIGQERAQARLRALVKP